MGKRANRLYELRKRKKASQTAVGLGVNLSQSRVSDYEHGEIIPSDLLILFADYFGVTTDYILMRTDDKKGILATGLTVDEQNILTFYRHLNPDGKEYMNSWILSFKKFIEGK